MRIARPAVTLLAPLLLAAGLAAGCYKDNPNLNCDASPEGCKAESCTASSGTCVCLQPDGVCVQCLPDDLRNCSADKPACGPDHLCRACVADDECPSNACLSDGQCADASNVIYAAPSGADTAGCGVQLGMNECSLARAALEVQGNRNIIRLRPGTYGVDATAGQAFPSNTVLIARGSTINRSGGNNGAILTVSGQSLTLIGGTVTGAITSGVQCSADGALRVHEATIIANTKSGIESDSCELTVSRSMFSGNLRGGIVMSLTGSPKPVTIMNNIVHNNGQGTMSTVGGMVLYVTGSSRVEFNTVVDNHAAQIADIAGGIRCNTPGTFDFPNNLVYRNTGGIGNQVQVIGQCTFTRSFQMDAPTGTENVPMFKDPNANPPDFHLTPQSPPAILNATTCSGLVDFDGDLRPQEGMCDLGADELKR